MKNASKIVSNAINRFLIKEGFIMYKYKDAISKIAKEAMNTYKNLIQFEAGDYDDDYDMRYEEFFPYAVEPFNHIEFRVYYDEESNCSFDAFFDEDYRHYSNRGLVCIFLNLDGCDSSDLQEVYEECTEFLNHELTHFLDSEREKQLGKKVPYYHSSDEEYADDVDEVIRDISYRLLNYTEWNAYQEEFISKPNKAQGFIGWLKNSINYLFKSDFSEADYTTAKGILNKLYKKDYSQVPNNTVKDKLIHELTKQCKRFEKHLNRKIKSMPQPSENEKNEKKLCVQIGRALADMIYHGDEYHESEYGEFITNGGDITIYGKKYHVKSEKNAGMESFTWEFVGTPIIVHENDCDFYDGIYYDNLPDIECYDLGKKVLDKFRENNII